MYEWLKLERTPTMFCSDTYRLPNVKKISEVDINGINLMFFNSVKAKIENRKVKTRIIKFWLKLNKLNPEKTPKQNDIQIDTKGAVWKLSLIRSIKLRYMDKCRYYF